MKIQAQCPKCKHYYYFFNDVQAIRGDLCAEKFDEEYSIYYRKIKFICNCSNCKAVTEYDELLEIAEAKEPVLLSALEEDVMLAQMMIKLYPRCVFDREENAKENKKIK